MGRVGGLAVLNLEGIFSRYENPDAVLDRINEVKGVNRVVFDISREGQGGPPVYLPPEYGRSRRLPPTVP
jgi:hypothetical protein